MYSLISDCIVIQMFYDIDFFIYWLGSIYWEYLDGWLFIMCIVQFGVYFEVFVVECFFFFGVDFFGQIGCCIIGLVVIDDVLQYYIVVMYVEIGIEVGYIVILV